MGSSSDEKTVSNQVIEPALSISNGVVADETPDQEVFKITSNGVNFRTVTWPRMIIILLKVQVATGVLGIPAALGSTGAVPGALLIVTCQVLNTYTACLLIDFRNRHPHCHNLVDIGEEIWGAAGREVVGLIFLVAQVIVTGSGILGTSIALNALSNHGACSVWFSFVATVMVILFSCIRTWDRMTWPLTFGFCSVFGGVLAVVIGVTLNDRPAAAPQTGPFDLGFHVVAHPSFAAGVTSALTIFISSSAGPIYVPIVAEMKRPQDYRKAVVPVGVLIGAIYLSFSMVVYYYCGTWIATPSLGSAGPLVKKVAYGIALPSLIISAGLFNHAVAKYTFVRFLRNSPHFQQNTWQHWSSWIGMNVGLGFLAFIVAEAIPVFNYILALAASVCLAPECLIIPAFAWTHEFGKEYRAGTMKQKAIFAFHWLLILIGVFLVVGGTYGTAESIKESYSAEAVFSCADNSNTIISSS